MVIDEMIVRGGAVVAAAVLACWPILTEIAVAIPKMLVKKTPVKPNPDDEGMADAHIVLEIAARLRSKGNKKGVELCKLLLDSMLQREGAA